MSHNFNLHIKTPCSERLENFQPTPNGGFCQSCQKEVIDFTQMTDREIFHFFENQKGKTCGRLGQTQLKTYSEAIQPKPNRRFGRIGAGLLSFSLLSLFPFNQTQAQQIPDSAKTYISLFDSLKNDQEKIEEDEHLVEGTVLGPDGKPLEGVCILVYKSHTTAFTDQNGRFEIYRPLNTGDRIVFSYVGFETKEYKISSSDPKVINLKETFLQCDLAWLGEVSVEHVYSSKPTFWQKFTGIFK